MKEKSFYYFLLPFSSIIIALLAAIITIIAYKAIPALKVYGISLISTSIWSPSPLGPPYSKYGLLAPLVGTVLTSALALSFSLPGSVSLLYLIEALPKKFRSILSSWMSILAGMPTVLFGIWGMQVLAPWLKSHVMECLYKYGRWIPLFSTPPYTGYCVLTASIVLSVMITPFVYSMIENAYSSFPKKYKEAILSCGARRHELFLEVLKALRGKVIGSSLLGLGRAMGETIAVSLVIGNVYSLPLSLLSPGYTISSLIASQFSEAGFYPMMTSVLYSGALVLIILGLLMNFLGTYLSGRCKYE